MKGKNIVFLNNNQVSEQYSYKTSTLQTIALDFQSKAQQHSKQQCLKAQILKMPQITTRKYSQHEESIDFQTTVNHSNLKSKYGEELQNSYNSNFNSQIGEIVEKSSVKQYSRKNRYAEQLISSYEMRNQQQRWKEPTTSVSGNCKLHYLRNEEDSFSPIAIKLPLEEKRFKQVLNITIVPILLIKKFKVICFAIGRLILLLKLIQLNRAKKKKHYYCHSPSKKVSNLTKHESTPFLENFITRDKDLNDTFQQWVNPSLQKIFHYFQNCPVFSCQNQEVQDQKSLWGLNFVKFLFQNLELITRKGNLPKSIAQRMSKAIYKENNPYVLFFIAKRTIFFNENITKQEYQLICSEYIIFRVFLLQFIEISNNLKFQSFSHRLECKIKIVELVSLLQIFYMRYFEKLPQQKIKEYNLYQKTLRITSDDDQKISVVSTLQIDKSEMLIAGLKNEEYFYDILVRKTKWQQNMGLIFDKIIQNIYSQIEIDDD